MRTPSISGKKERPTVIASFFWLKSIAVLVVFAGMITTYYSYKITGIDYKKDFLVRAQTISHGIDKESVMELTGGADDIYLEPYQEIKKSFSNIARANNDIRFVYLMKIIDDDVVFLVDSENPVSEDYSGPGDVYYEAPKAIHDAISEELTTVEFVQDRWGSWFSGFVPIYDDKGNFIAQLGVDTSSESYNQRVISSVTIPALSTLVVLFIVFLSIKSKKKELEFMELQQNFLSVATHQIRTPLTGIRWTLESSLKMETLTELRTNVKQVHGYVENLIEAVNDLLLALRIGKSAKIKEDVDVIDVVNQAIGLETVFAQSRNITITFNKNDSVPSVHIEKQGLVRAISNIISNAIKYSPEHKSVTVTVTQENGDVVVSCKDQGIGIPKDEIKELRYGFYRASNAQKMTRNGTGIGLVSSIRFIEQAKGTLDIVSEENKGTEIIIKLPTN